MNIQREPIKPMKANKNPKNSQARAPTHMQIHIPFTAQYCINLVRDKTRQGKLHPYFVSTHVASSLTEGLSALALQPGLNQIDLDRLCLHYYVNSGQTQITQTHTPKWVKVS